MGDPVDGDPTERGQTAEVLRGAGKLAEAATAYRRRGELLQAERLYAELWDFAAAAEVARERGDAPAELGHLLSANDLPAAARVGECLERGSEHDLRRAAEVYERHRRWVEAGAMRERLGELEAARELYRRGQALLEVARLERGLGRTREAGIAYEQLLARDGDGPEAGRAHLELGQLLLALDRVEEAARHLRAATRASAIPLRAAALADLASSLDRLGYEYACEAVLDELRAIAPDTPTRVVFLDRHLAPAAEGPSRLGGRYEIERLVAAGAGGRLFLARDAISGRPVSVQLLTPTQDARAREARGRYFDELRRLASLRHPNIVELIDVDEARGLVVSELSPGGSLLDRLPPPQRQDTVGLAPAAVRRLLLDVVDGLAAAHARGVVHRDLKPAHLFYSATGQVRIGGFGSVHLFTEEVTQTAGFIGTLAYMAPEQVGGLGAGTAVDVYSLGAVAFQALTGRLAFPGPDFIAQHLGDRPPPPSSLVAGLDRAWDELVTTMLQKDPQARPGALDQLRRAIERIPVGDEPRGAVAAALAERPAPTSARYVAESPLLEGPGGPVALGIDHRLGRPVVIETLSANYLGTEAGQRHLAWLRALARLGGPRLQRLFALIALPDGDTQAIFEALGSSVARSSPSAAAPLRASPTARSQRRSSSRPTVRRCSWPAGPRTGPRSPTTSPRSPRSSPARQRGRSPHKRWLGPGRPRTGPCRRPRGRGHCSRWRRRDGCRDRRNRSPAGSSADRGAGGDPGSRG